MAHSHPLSGSPYKTVQVNNFNKLHVTASGSTWRKIRCLQSKTGQTTGYYTGDDGYIQAGVPWPEPRFADNGDGTITDNLTGLMWLKDGHCFGTLMSWQDALDTVADFNANPSSYNCEDCTATHTDWRLPNINEIESLLNASEADMTPWLQGQGFVDVGAMAAYWSSTTKAGDASTAWYVQRYASNVQYTSKSSTRGVWPVRDATTQPAKVWKTGQTTSHYTGDDGHIQAGFEWPEPRFSDNGDGTVKEATNLKRDIFVHFDSMVIPQSSKIKRLLTG